MAVFTPVEEVHSGLVAPWEQVEKVARDFCRVGWVDDPYITISTVGLEEGLVLMDTVGVPEEAAGTLVGAVETMKVTPAEEGEDRSIPEKISKTNVVIIQLVMVR